MASEASLREAAALGLVVGALYQVQTYLTLLPTLTRNGADAGLAGADLDWINRSLTRHEQGLESPGLTRPRSTTFRRLTGLGACPCC